MSRPAQLEKQIERVKEIQEQMAEGEKPPVQANEPVAETPPAVTPTEPATQTVVDESPVTVSKDEYNKLEQRYRTLQGMHAAEGQRSRAEIASLQAALQDLEDRLVATERTAKPAPTPSRYVTEEDEREYGDTLDMVRRAAKEEAEAIALKREQEYLDRIANLERLVGHVQNTVVPTVENITRGEQERVKADFWSAINIQVPDWETINQDPKFKAWLLTEDSLTGSNRQQFLAQAQREYNAPRVIKFFQEWKRTAAGGQTPAPNTTQNELERLVAPGASKGGTVPVTPEKKKWTGADIGQFYKDVATGKYADKPEERKKIEADIFLAQREGRVS